jgi:hypothetical protein
LKLQKIDYKFLDRENDLTDVGGGYHVYKDRLKDLVAQNYNQKEKEAKEKVLLKIEKKWKSMETVLLDTLLKKVLIKEKF